MLCSYGCEEPALFTLKTGKLCCSSTFHKCKAIKSKNSAGLSIAYAEGRKDCSQFDETRGWAKGKNLVSNDDVFVENGKHSSQFLKERIIKDSLMPHQCADCSLTDTWQGKPIVLELDHINGVGNDNRLLNLRFLCPNCHSQTATFRGRNINAKRVKVSDEALLQAFKEGGTIRQALIAVGLVPKGANYTRVSKLIAESSINNGAMVERSTQGT